MKDTKVGASAAGAGRVFQSGIVRRGVGGWGVGRDWVVGGGWMWAAAFEAFSSDGNLLKF